MASRPERACVRASARVASARPRDIGSRYHDAAMTETPPASPPRTGRTPAARSAPPTTGPHGPPRGLGPPPPRARPAYLPRPARSLRHHPGRGRRGRRARGARCRRALPATSSSSRSRATSAQRLPGTENPRLATGEIELQARALTILAEAKTPPFYINEPDAPVDESVRLQYRYLDIRREPMLRRMLLRSKLVSEIRRVHEDHGFVEIETPILIKSTPEGARDFIVPSRLQPGTVYALPAEPPAAQAAPDGRRHGPLLPDRPLLPGRGPSRRPAAGVHPARPRDELRDGGDGDGLRRGDGDRRLPRRGARSAAPARPVPALHLRRGARALSAPTSRISASGWSWSTSRPSCAARAGRPSSGFRVFDETLASGGRVKAIAVPGHRRARAAAQVDELTETAKRFGARGLVHLAVAADGIHGPDRQVPRRGAGPGDGRAAGAAEGDLLLIVADAPHRRGRRPRAAARRARARLGLADPDVLAYCWVHRFPMYEWDEERNGWHATHNPFSGVVPEDESLLVTASGDPYRPRTGGPGRAGPGRCSTTSRSTAGSSAAGRSGSIAATCWSAASPSRATRREAMHEKFGGMLEAFDYGAPPHGGIALGIDRWACVFAQPGRTSAR